MCTDATEDAVNCNSECCEKDTATCGGLDATKAIVCPFDQYKDTSNVAWKKIAATEKTKVKKCCQAKAKCASAIYKPPPGKKKNAANGAVQCMSNAASCAETA